MLCKKRGRPRKFDKKAFLNEIHAGCSRKDACERLRVSYKTLQYHLGKDNGFLAQVREAEYKAKCEVSWEKYCSKTRIKKFKEKHGVTLSVFNDILRKEPPETWFQTSEYHQKECNDFDVYLKHLIERNPRGFGPAISKLRKWLKWNPEKRGFITVSFFIDEEVRHWTSSCPVRPFDMDAWIEKTGKSFEEFKKNDEFHEHIESLSPDEVLAVQEKTNSLI